MKFQSLKGMDDIVSPEIEKWQVLEERTRRFFEAHGFREIRTPILELSGLFVRSIGEASDIIHKEMYSFEDRGGRQISLRPEMTASVVRSALEHQLVRPDSEPMQVYYLGPMFRAERPQAGRKRQFHQIGVEMLNTTSGASDAELILAAKNYLEWLGVKEFLIKLNHLGSESDREQFAKNLKEYFENASANLCEDCKYRLTRNVLRIFDCKNEACQSVIEKAPEPKLSKEANDDFSVIRSILETEKVCFQYSPRLVRGLDYYTGLVFEVTAKGLGAQDAVLAGGRYDGLISDLGGPRLGANGFSIGVERLLLVLEHAGIHLEKIALADTIYVAVLDETSKYRLFARKINQALVDCGKRVRMSMQKSSLGSHLKRANKIGAAFTIIVGEDELSAGEVTIKKMDTGDQKRLKPEELLQYFLTTK